MHRVRRIGFRRIGTLQALPGGTTGTSVCERLSARLSGARSQCRRSANCRSHWVIPALIEAWIARPYYPLVRPQCRFSGLQRLVAFSAYMPDQRQPPAPFLIVKAKIE